MQRGPIRIRLHGEYDEPKKKKSKKKDATFISMSSALLEQSAVTGVTAVIKSRGCCRKSVKILIIAVGVAGFLYQSFQFLQLYWAYSTVPSMVRMSKMKKPAITICDKNLIRRKYFCEMRPKLCGDFTEGYGVDQGCMLFGYYCLDPNDMYFLIPDEPEITYRDAYYELNFTRDYGFQISDNLQLCEWIYSDPSQNSSQGTLTRPCSEFKFVRGISNDKLPGACYTLESTIGEISAEDEILERSTRLTMSMRWRTSDMTNQIPDMTSTTNPIHRVYFISFHNPRALSNPFSDGITIEDRKEYKIFVTETDFIRLPPPYSNQCYDYIEEWKKNGGNGPLKREDCQKICEIDAYYDKYGCIPRIITYPHGKELCPRQKPFDEGLNLKIQDCAEKCRDACYETKYSAKTEITGQVSLYEQLDTLGTPSTVEVEIEFDALRSMISIEKPKYEDVELFSYLGGYLGMWLGWSLVAICDFFEILSRVVMYPCIMRKKAPRHTAVKPLTTDRYFYY